MSPTLAARMRDGVVGVLPTRMAGADSDPLRDACETLGRGDRSRISAPGSQSLGRALAQNRVSVRVVASDDGAADRLAGASSTAVSAPPQALWRAEASDFPDGYVTTPDAFAAAVQEAATGAPRRLVVADFDDLYRAERYAPLALPAATDAQRRAALGRLDQVIAALIAAPDRPPLLLVSPIAPASAVRRGERFGPILYVPAGNTGTGGLLTSPSTRGTPGLVAGTDFGATIAALLGLPPDAQRIGVGRAARVTDAESGDALDGQIATWSAQSARQRGLIYVPWALAAVMVLATALSLRNPRKTCRIGNALGPAATLFPLSLLLSAAVLPAGVAAGAFYLCAALACLALFAFLWLTGFGRRHVREALAAVAALTVLAYIVDTVFLHGTLNARSPLAYSVAEAARYYGLGNEAVGVLMGAGLTAAVLFGADWLPALVLGLALALLIAHPALGAKAGGLIGVMAGFGTLTILSAGVTRRRGRRDLTAAAGILLLLMAAATIGYALWDAVRSPDVRTHVGEAVAQARLSGIGALAAIAGRKLAMDVHLLGTSPWAILFAAEAGTSAFLWRRANAPRNPAVHAVASAMVVAALFLLAADDAGVLAAANCLLFLPPLLLAYRETK